MSLWFRTWREHSDDPQNTMLAEIYRLVLQTRSEVTSSDTASSDLEKKRVEIIPTESYIIIITGACFVKGETRPVNRKFLYQAAREPNGSICNCMIDFNYRKNVIDDRSTAGNNILLKGLPKIISYQPEYPPSSLRLDGTAYVNMGNTQKLKIGELGAQSISLDGSNNYIDLGARTSLWSRNLSKFSVSMWVKPSGAFGVNYKTFFGCADDPSGGVNTSTDAEISMYFIKGGVDSPTYNAIGCDVTNDNYATTNNVFSSSEVFNGEWYNVLLTFNNSLTGNCLKLYVNASLQSNPNDYADDYNAKVLDIDSGTKAYLGKYIAADTNEYGGKIKDVRYWYNKELTPEEAILVRDNDPAAPTPSYWLPMTEGTGNPLDSVGGIFTGVLTNGPVWSADAPDQWINTEVTAAYWVYFSSNPASNAHIISRGSTQSYLGFIATNGNLKAQFWYHDGTNVTLDSGISGISGWHRVMLSHSKTNTKSKLWVDGVLVASNTKDDYLRNSGTGGSSRFMLGAKSTGTSTQSNFVNGNIKNVMLWKRQLTDDEALADYNGDYVSPLDLVSEWDFDEDEFSTIAVDSQSYNTGTITNGSFDKNQLPFSLTAPVPYKDGVVNELIGYRTTGNEYLVIPELSDDFRISNMVEGGNTYEWVAKFSTFDNFNGQSMRLLEKADDFTLNYFQSAQVRSDGKIYLMYKFNGNEKKLRTVNPLKLNKLYRIGLGLDYSQVGSTMPTADPGTLNLDTFGINKLWNTKAGGKQWFSTAWNSSPRSIDPDEFDPNDPELGVTSSTLTINGDGTATFGTYSESSRVYVHGPWTNTEITCYVKADTAIGSIQLRSRSNHHGVQKLPYGLEIHEGSISCGFGNYEVKWMELGSDKVSIEVEVIHALYERHIAEYTSAPKPVGDGVYWGYKQITRTIDDKKVLVQGWINKNIADQTAWTLETEFIFDGTNVHVDPTGNELNVSTCINKGDSTANDLDKNTVWLNPGYWCWLRFNQADDVVIKYFSVREIDPIYTETGTGDATDIFKLYLNGFPASLQTTTDATEFPDVDNINDFHTYMLTGHTPGIGNYVGQIYSFRSWAEVADDSNMLSTMTNKFTTKPVDRGHVIVSNLSKIAETNKDRENTFTLESNQITDLFEYFLTDTVPTGRFTTNNVVIDDDFDFTLDTPVHHYSLKLNGSSAYVEIPVIDPVRRHFSISVWVKYKGNSGGWGGIISRIDGMPNGNRLLLQDTKIRWHAKYGDADDPFVDYIASVPSITNDWHHISMTYDGEDDERLKLFLDGSKVLDKHQEHQIKGGDDEEHSKTYIGKGADSNYYLNGNLDTLIIYDRTLTESEVRKLASKQEVRTGIMAKFIFENNYKDTSDNADFNGTGRGGAGFSTSVP